MQGRERQTSSGKVRYYKVSGYICNHPGRGFDKQILEACFCSVPIRHAMSGPIHINPGGHVAAMKRTEPSSCGTLSICCEVVGRVCLRLGPGTSTLVSGDGSVAGVVGCGSGSQRKARLPTIHLSQQGHCEDGALAGVLGAVAYLV